MDKNKAKEIARKLGESFDNVVAINADELSEDRKQEIDNLFENAMEIELTEEEAEMLLSGEVDAKEYLKNKAEEQEKSYSPENPLEVALDGLSEFLNALPIIEAKDSEVNKLTDSLLQRLKSAENYTDKDVSFEEFMEGSEERRQNREELKNFVSFLDSLKEMSLIDYKISFSVRDADSVKLTLEEMNKIKKITSLLTEIHKKEQ